MVDFVNEEEDTKEVVQGPQGVPKSVASGKEGTASGPMVPQGEEIHKNQQTGAAGNLEERKTEGGGNEKKSTPVGEGGKTEGGEDDDVIELVNEEEEKKGENKDGQVGKERKAEENDQTDDETVEVVNDDLAEKEAEARAKQLKEEKDIIEAEQELIDLVNQEQEVTEARYEYFNIAQDVLNRPNDPTTYRELLEEFERLRSIVSVDDPLFNPREYFNFSEENGRIKVNFLHPDIRFLEFDKGCSYFLGFTDTIVRETLVAPHKVDLFGDVSVIYLYSDVVEPIIVGNKKTNLLSVIPCTGQYGSVVYYTVPNPRYVPLINSTIDSIRIELLTDGGDPIPFSWGTTIAVLHFKKLK